MAAVTSKASSTSSTTVAVVAAASVAVVAIGSVLLKKRRAAMANSRVHPFNAETDATVTNDMPTRSNDAAPAVHDGSKRDDRWAKIFDV